MQSFGKPHNYYAGLQIDPKANRVRTSAWSPDDKQLAFIANFDAASHVFVADVATAKAVQVTKTPLLAGVVSTVDWTADDKSVIALVLPEGRGAEPKKPEIAICTSSPLTPLARATAHPLVTRRRLPPRIVARARELPRITRFGMSA